MPNYLAKFFYILSGRKKSLFLLLISVFFTSSLETLGIGLLGPFIALASNPSYLEKSSLLQTLYNGLGLKSPNYFIGLLGLIIIGIFILKSGLILWLKKNIFQFAYNNQGNLRLRLFDNYLAAPYTFHLTRNIATAIQNILNETSQFSSLLLEVLNSCVNVVILSFLILLLIATDPIAMLIISVTLIIAFSINYRFRHKFSHWGKEMSKSQTNMIRTVEHGLGGIKEAKVFDCKSYFVSELKGDADRYARMASSFIVVRMFPRIAIEVIMIAFIIGLTSLYLLFNRDSEHLLTTLGIFAIVAIRLMPSVNQLTSGFASIRANSYIVSKLYNDLKELEAPNTNNNSKSLNSSNRLDSIESSGVTRQSRLPFEDKIAIERLFYRYSGSSEDVLQSIGLVIEKGQSIALIGKSGAGKTTLVDIILGLLTPNSGDIKVDDRSIYGDLRSWQNMIGYIPQSIFLMDDTIERNIAFGVPDREIDRERLERAIAAAQLKELIAQLPEGVKTSVGERGVRLSGGQRQRIGIARALYHERAILVLDEATSALDNETEALVTEAIKSLGRTKTMIIIAHRLTTVEHCDRIYLMEGGKIVKSGSYAEVVLGASLQLEERSS